MRQDKNDGRADTLQSVVVIVVAVDVIVSLICLAQTERNFQQNNSQSINVTNGVVSYNKLMICHRQHSVYTLNLFIENMIIGSSPNISILHS